MKPLDVFIQNQRIRKVTPFIQKDSVVLDIGCDNGVLLDEICGKIRDSVGIDPNIAAEKSFDTYTLLPGYFPNALKQKRDFDVITMLAVLEHIPPTQQRQLVEDILGHSKKGSIIIITVPSPSVDIILNVLTRLKLIDGMSTEQHYGFTPDTVMHLFNDCHFDLVVRKKFQFGLNNLFVFRRR